MCVLSVNAQGYDRFFEVLPDEVENVELMVEDVMSHVLMDLFDEGTVDEVTVQFSSDLRMGLKHCAIQIRAQCSCQYFTLFPRTRENMELAVEKSMRARLKELFGSVNVEGVTLLPVSRDCEHNPAPSCRL